MARGLDDVDHGASKTVTASFTLRQVEPVPGHGRTNLYGVYPRDRHGRRLAKCVASGGLGNVVSKHIPMESVMRLLATYASMTSHASKSPNYSRLPG